jgi:hypothetical protein
MVHLNSFTSNLFSKLILYLPIEDFANLLSSGKYEITTVRNAFRRYLSTYLFANRLVGKNKRRINCMLNSNLTQFKLAIVCHHLYFQLGEEHLKTNWKTYSISHKKKIINFYERIYHHDYVRQIPLVKKISDPRGERKEYPDSEYTIYVTTYDYEKDKWETTSHPRNWLY